MGLGSETLITEVRDLLAGRLVVPSIQRGYVWQKAQVPKLLDSLYRGYPIGTLLIWNTSIEVPLRQAAVLQKEQHISRPGVLLDGQQRLTSLAKVLDPAAIIGGRLDVRFDLDNEEFINPSSVMARSPRMLRVTELIGDGAQFSALLRTAGVENDDPNWDLYYERARRVHAIRDYLVPVVTVDSDDYEVVAEIFARVNQGGKRLSKGDLVYSAIAARWPDGLDTIEAFNEQLDGQNFALDREAVLRLTGLLAGTGAHAIKLIGKSVSGDDLKQAWATTESALRLAVDFLKGECGIPRSGVLTSPNVVVLPAYLLHLRGGTLSASDSESLRRWVYTSMAFSRYSNQVEGKLDIEARLVREKSGDALWNDLLTRASGARPVGTKITANEVASRTYSSAWFNLLYIAALRRQARDWKSNTTLLAAPMTSTSKIEYHHIFPKARVQARFGRELTNNIANLAFISGTANRWIGQKPPSEYLLGIATDRLLEQWVPDNANLWELDRFEDFLAARQELVAAALNELLGLDVTGEVAHLDAEAFESEDDEVLGSEAGTEQRYNGRRRNVAQHIVECFTGRPPGTEFTIAEVVAMPSAQYAAGEISAGAVAARMHSNPPPGIEIVPGASPLAIRMTRSSTTDEDGTARRHTPVSVPAQQGGASPSAPNAKDVPDSSPPTSSATTSPAELEGRFHAAMVDLYKRSHNEAGYTPTMFIHMIAEVGGVEAARRLVRTATPSTGFTVLWEKGRLDLTAEALVVQPEFAPLFSEDDIERASARLAYHGFFDR